MKKIVNVFLLLLLVVPFIGFGQCEDKCNKVIPYTNAEYTGCVNENNKQDGYGTLMFKSGESYIGCWKDGKQDGQGTYTWADGGKYVGEWKDDMRNGQGTQTWANGNKYVGEFKDGKLDGQGTYTSADGDKYVGEFKDGKQDGQGTYYYSDGSVWTGLWIDDKKFDGHYEDENYYDINHISGDVDFSIINLNKLVDVSGEGCYNITLSFNGTNAEFLFDTGCSSMLINKEFLQKLKANGVQIKQLNNSSGRTASNQEVLMSQVIISNIKVGDFIINNLVVGVIESGSLLCGLGLFKKFSNAEWNMKAKTIKLYR
jgi:hypothetical protein